jgi:thiamine kinase-like enzyme
MTNSIKELKQGYGKFLTKITYTNGFLEKKCLNEEGKIKLRNEIGFYKFILNKKFNNYLPKILNYSEDYFNMEFLENYVTLERYLRSNSINDVKLNKIIVNIKEILENNLYNEKIVVNKKEFIKNLLLETTGKIFERTAKINFIIEKYNFISNVNGLKILNLNDIIKNIEKIIEKYISENEQFIYYPIHGDIQLNNILIDSDDETIKFIDPRGYFGNSKIYGMKEYDYAKLYFGLGGYSYFDFKDVNELTINNKNIIIDMKEMINILEQPYIIQVLIICIWLGNAHCFIENEYKVVESYFYACYISTLVLNNFNRNN